MEYDRRADGGTVCTTLFTSDIAGIIRSWNYQGSDCRPAQLGGVATGS